LLSLQLFFSALPGFLFLQFRSVYLLSLGIRLAGKDYWVTQSASQFLPDQSINQSINPFFLSFFLHIDKQPDRRQLPLTFFSFLLQTFNGEGRIGAAHALRPGGLGLGGRLLGPWPVGECQCYLLVLVARRSCAVREEACWVW
jgi:hypothetical protein